MNLYVSRTNFSTIQIGEFSGHVGEGLEESPIVSQAGNESKFPSAGFEEGIANLPVHFFEGLEAVGDERRTHHIKARDPGPAELGGLVGGGRA